jgi:hypothetical protein
MTTRPTWILLASLCAALASAPLALADWPLEGVALSTKLLNSNPQSTPDSTGGAIVVFRSGTQVYVQRVDSSGVVQWGVDGVLLGSQASTFEPYYSIIPDGASGAFVTWSDGNIRAQHVSAAGRPRSTSAWRAPRASRSTSTAPMAGASGGSWREHCPPAPIMRAGTCATSAVAGCARDSTGCG